MVQKEGNEYIIITASQNQAISLYNNLKNQECVVKIMSAPCTLSNGCAKCIRFGEKDMELVLEEVLKYKIRIKGIYQVTKNYAGNVKYVLIKGPDI